MALLGAGHSNYNLRYDELNHRLVSVKRASGLSRASSSQFLPGETRTFAEVLDQEVERIVMYYLRVQGDLASEAWKLRENQLSCLDYFDVTVEKIDILCEKYRVLAQHVIDLLTFLEYNVNSLRSIIRKYDAVYDKKIGSTYFDTRIKSNQQNSQLMQIYHQEGIRAIIGTIRRGLLDLHDARCVLTDDGEICDNNQNDVKTVRKIPKMTYRARMASFSSLFKLDHQGLSSASIESVTPRMSRGESMSGTNNCSNRPKRSISDLEPLLTRLDSAANRVMKSQKMSFNDYITGHSQMGLEMSIRDMYYIEEEDGKKNKRRHFRDEFRMKFGLYLNLIMTFVFTMNQYVIAPTSGQYARMLGMSPAMGGCIIGFSPLATLLGALIYSKWSNYSFRDPLLACVLCGIFGNLMYATALQCDSPALIFAGRLIGGLGGPRGIARRYIADHVATKDRTVASSQFIAASALGLASGPLMASLIERSHQSFQVFYPRSEHIMILYQNVTAPGWILCVAWLIQLVFLLLYFEDPLKVCIYS